MQVASSIENTVWQLTYDSKNNKLVTADYYVEGNKFKEKREYTYEGDTLVRCKITQGESTFDQTWHYKNGNLYKNIFSFNSGPNLLVQYITEYSDFDTQKNPFQTW